MTSHRAIARQLTIAIAGFGALGAVGFADSTIGDDVDFTAIYLAVITAVAWTSRLAVANLSAVAALGASLGADVVAHPPDLNFVLVWNGAGGLAAFAGVAMLVHYARAERDELRLAATHDSLTTLPHRVLFLDRLEHALALSRRRGPGPSVLALDLDGFKQVNDLYGHHAGDTVLVGTAERLAAAFASPTRVRDSAATSSRFCCRTAASRAAREWSLPSNVPSRLHSRSMERTSRFIRASVARSRRPTETPAPSFFGSPTSGCTETSRLARDGFRAPPRSRSTCTSTAEWPFRPRRVSTAFQCVRDLHVSINYRA